MNMILTNIGEELASNGFLTGVFPKVTKVIFGDGNGSTVIPDKTMTTLVNQIQEGVGTTIVKLANPNRLYIYTQIPTSIGGITLREVGLFTEDNILIAVGGNFTKVKPPISESTEKFDIYINIPMSSAQEITVEFSNDNIYADQNAVDLISNAEEDNRLDIQDIKLNLLPLKLNITDVVNTLTSTLTNKPLSAAQGKVLKDMINTINTLLLSDNTTLNSLQEVVDFIEANRDTLNTLGIGNIAGLQNALNTKLDASLYTAVDVLNKVKTVDGSGSGLDADLVDGYEGAYLAGLDYGDSTADPNTAIYPYILTNHANAPTTTSYWHIRTQFYSSISVNSNVAQIAMQYNGGNQVWARSKYGSVWTPWVRLDNNGISGGASSIVTTNLAASRAVVSDANGKVAASAVTSTELGYLGGVTSSIQEQLGTKAPLSSPVFTGTPTAPTATTGNNSTQIATTAFVAGAVISAVPVSTIIALAGSAVPVGFLECSGATISRSTYSNLFSKIGTLYGAGNGSTTFNLPDLRGEFIRGWDNSRGVDTGRVFGSFQADDFKSHNHLVETNGYAGDGQGNLALMRVGNPKTNPSTNTGGTETRPRNIALMYCIKY